jgi:sugar phosphate isomerase/epimerase
VRLFGPLAEANPDQIAAWRARLASLGLVVPAMQGVLFGLDGLHLFRSAEERARLVAALTVVARVAGALGAKAAVFGAPALRDPGDLAPALAFEIAAETLAQPAAAFEAEGAALCFEPVAPALGGRFVTTTAEAVALVRAIGRPGIRVQADTGNLLTLGHDAAALAAALPFAGHLHVSEPKLAPVGSLASCHAALAKALRAGGPSWVSVEMLPAPKPEAALRRAFALLSTMYLRDEE